jgi:beta-lactamase class A
MIATHTRRGFVAGAVSATAMAGPARAADRIAALEARSGGRLGVAALDLADGAQIAHRADQRFPMFSTFKALAAAAVLARVDRGAENLARVIPYEAADLLDHSPVTQAHAGQHGMALGDLCAAAVEVSDNTAANLVLAQIGGPAGWTAFARTLGDHASRLDRTEPTLNHAAPGDPRDTTTPLAMLADLKMVTLGKILTADSRERLTGWMAACKTGLGRLRAGLPPDWRAVDKTGTGGASGGADIAAAWAPRAPILITAYLIGATVPAAETDSIYAEVGRIVAETFRPAARERRLG